MAVKTSRNFADKGLNRSSVEQAASPRGVQVRERSGIWEVSNNGGFRGDYHQKEHALEAAARLTGSRR